jgi:hypothetical protein
LFQLATRLIVAEGLEAEVRDALDGSITSVVAIRAAAIATAWARAG